jgi:PAS domain S-box-containing protein
MNESNDKQTTPEPERAPPRGENGFFPDTATVHTALEAGKVGVWSWDIASNVVTWSSNLEAIHRLSPGSFDGSHAFFASEIHEQDRDQVASSIEQTLRTGRPYWVRYRMSPRQDGEDCWIEARGTVRMQNGTPVRMVGICQDVTERVNLEAELRNRVTQQEALARLGERALAEGDLDALLNDVVSTVATTLPVDFVEVLELLPGDTDLLLRAGFGWKTGVIGTIVTSRDDSLYARYTLESATPVVVADFTTETRFTMPRYLADHHCVSGVGSTIAGRDGRAYGILSVCTKQKREFGVQDSRFLAAVGNLVAGAIQRRQLEDRHELMIRELRHRSGNLFSQLLALYSQTAKNSKTMAELTTKYQARVLALANAHRLITEGGWKSTTLAELLRVLLGPYLDRTTFEGPNVDLEPDPTFSLSAALHELTANASKHGSLSRPQGRLELSWSVERARRGLTLTLDWVERYGPPARRPRRFGFGARLIGLVIERQMNGEVHPTYRSDGLSVRLVVPLTHERWPTQPEAIARPPATA